MLHPFRAEIGRFVCRKSTSLCGAGTTLGLTICSRREGFSANLGVCKVQSWGYLVVGVDIPGARRSSGHL